jgi:hypothetical protein
LARLRLGKMNRHLVFRLLRFTGLLLLILMLSGCLTDALGQVPVETETSAPVNPTPIIPTSEQEATETNNLPEPTDIPSPTSEDEPGSIYFITGGELLIANPQTLEQTRLLSLSPGINGASISPDFEMLAYANGSLLNIINIETGEQIGEIGGESGETVIPRGYSPISTSQYSQLLIRRDTPDASTFGIIDFTPDFSWQSLPEPPNTDHYGCDTGSAWSPNGDRILITGLGYGMNCNVNPGVTLFSLRRGMTFSIFEQELSKGLTGKEMIIGGARTPAWAPDGKSMFVSIEDETVAPLQFVSRIYQIDETGTTANRITNNNRGVAAYPVMVDTNILLYSITGDSPQTDGIYIHNLTDGIITLEEKGAGLCPLALSMKEHLLLYGRTCNEYSQTYELRVKTLGENSSKVLARSKDGLPISYLGWSFRK